jgi:hypothetical protein
MYTDGPDFQTALRSGGLAMYRKYSRPGDWIVFPHALDIGLKADGTPDFQLDLVRSAGPGPAGYGVVDFRVRPVLDLALAQQAVPDGQVYAGDFLGGWLRLLAREPGATESAVLLPPLRLAANGLGVVRLACQTTPEAISLLKRALLDGTVLVEAWAEMRTEGVAPRLAATVTVRSADWVGLLPAGAGNGLVTRAAVIAALAQPGIIAGLPPDIGSFPAAEAVADRLFNLIGTPAPSPEKDYAECWRLDLESGNTRFEWDLSQVTPARRTQALRFDPVGLVRQALAAGGLERLVTRHDLPEFKTGYVPVLVTANLTDVRSPALSCGVDIEAPARPPRRLNAIRESVEFEPPGDRRELILRFAADEAPDYQIQTFVLAHTEAGIQEWRAPRKPHSGGELRLTVDDFAAQFVPVEAAPQLLDEGAVEVIASWDGASEKLALTPDKPVDTLVCARTPPPVSFACRLSRSGRVLQAPVPAGDRLFLDLTLFREYGAHDLEVVIDFTGGPDLVALELKPENAPDSAATTLAFTALKPARGWNWFASSPFAPGYCYRPRQTDNSLPWSAAQSPFANLQLKARELAEAGRPVTGGADAQLTR